MSVLVDSLRAARRLVGYVRSLAVRGPGHAARARHVAAPARHIAAHSRHIAARSRHVAAPARRIAAPARRLAAHSRRLLAAAWHRHWRGGLTASVALTGLALLALAPAGVALGVHDAAQPDPRAAGGTHHLGTEVRDGAVTFVAHKIHCGAAPEQSTNGKLCEITVGARNDGAAPVTVPGLVQFLHSADGARHLPAGDRAPFGVLEPGGAATATLRFDLPPRATATGIELHASAYSPGVTVAVGTPYPLVPVTRG